MIEKFFQNVLELKNIPRQGWKEKLGINNPESVAEHSYSTAAISMILSDLEGLNTEKIIKMALLHVLAESISISSSINTIPGSSGRSDNFFVFFLVVLFPALLGFDFVFLVFIRNSETNMMTCIKILSFFIPIKISARGGI